MRTETLSYNFPPCYIGTLNQMCGNHVHAFVNNYSQALCRFIFAGGHQAPNVVDLEEKCRPLNNFQPKLPSNSDRRGGNHVITIRLKRPGLVTLVNYAPYIHYLSRVVRKQDYYLCENKVTDQLCSAFVFATQKVQPLVFLNPKFQASSHLQCLYSSICVGPGRKSQRPVFSHCGSYRMYLACHSITYYMSK